VYIFVFTVIFSVGSESDESRGKRSVDGMSTSSVVEGDRGVVRFDESYDDDEYEDDGGEELDDMFATSRARKEVLN
jgi:hypothetical protein